MALRERIENGSVTNLNGTINDSTTTVAVADASVFSPVAQFRIIIDSEIMLVTDITGNNLTVVRGAESSNAAPHTDGAVVAQIITRDGLRDYISHNAVPMFGNTARPPAVVQNQAGTDLTLASFTAFNSTGTTAQDYTGGRGIGFSVPPSASNSLRGWAKAAPTPPWTLTVWGGMQGENLGLSQFIIGVKETGAAAATAIGFRPDGYVHQTWTNPTTFGVSSNYTTCEGQPYGFWLQIEDDNTNLIFRGGIDGVIWRDIRTELRLSNVTSIDEVFFGGNESANDFGMLGSLYAWIEE